MGKTKRRMTAKKRKAIHAFSLGMDEKASCEFAGYDRPDTAAQKVFERDTDGEFLDTNVQAELDRLAGEVKDAKAGGVDMETLPKEVLAQMVRDPNTSDTARVSASRALDSIQERERQAALANDTGADEYAAADALRQMLSMPRLSREQHEAWKRAKGGAGD